MKPNERIEILRAAYAARRTGIDLPSPFEVRPSAKITWQDVVFSTVLGLLIFFIFVF